MMKKFAVFMVIAVLMTAALLFADEDYIVRSVSGRVEQELAPHKWASVTVGTVITGSTVITTGINARLVLTVRDEIITIQPLQRGPVDRLVKSEEASTHSGDGAPKAADK
ncbi:hypothetical protein AGMMS49991_10510 [Spirochaetia bacterium]|nr:hypothetical protein AGMMS49991_10510 [Spirochaetia bacterium]